MTRHHVIPQRPFHGDYTITTAAWPWGQREPELIDCDHADGDDSRFICADCETQLRLILEAIPALIEDLDIAIARDVAFVEHGTNTHPLAAHPWVQVLNEDETRLPEGFSRTPYNKGASSAKRDLAEALNLAGPDPAQASADWLEKLPILLLWDQIKASAREISWCVRAAHRIIDRPRDDQYLGDCPHCETELHAELGDKEVTCGECGYTNTVEDVLYAALRKASDRLMTVAELTTAIPSLSPKNLRDWTRKGRLEEHEIQVLKANRFVSIRAYRLADVLDLSAGKRVAA